MWHEAHVEPWQEPGATVLGCEAVQHAGITCTWVDMRNTVEDPKGNNRSGNPSPHYSTS